MVFYVLGVTLIIIVVAVGWLFERHTFNMDLQDASRVIGDQDDLIYQYEVELEEHRERYADAMSALHLALAAVPGNSADSGLKIESVPEFDPEAEVEEFVLAEGVESDG